MPEPAAPATIAGRYVLGEVLGRGGVADVHAADDTLLSRRVAVKVLRETADEASARERFTREAHLLAQLSHAGMVTVLDAGTEVDRPYLVMELVDGSTLGQLVARGPLAPERVAELGALVADALAHAHRHGVVHRDVKPGNVLVAHDGRVKVVDLGIARLVGDTVRHTRTGHAVGTAAYLAPEQVLGQDVGPPADVYALGLVLLEALTGRREYVGTPTEAALARLHRSPDVPATLPGPWRRLLVAMTARDAVDRPDAAGVAAALRELRRPAQPTQPTQHTQPAEHTAVLGAVPPRPASTRPPATRSRRALLSVAGVLVLLLVAVVALLLGRDPVSEPRPLPDGTPADLRGPLGDLHDAVEGR